jgi:hypothetical protein
MQHTFAAKEEAKPNDQYDLHGVWDRNNPIGSIVQEHTNLTEIALATELFW